MNPTFMTSLVVMILLVSVQFTAVAASNVNFSSVTITETIGDGDLEHGETIGDGDLEHGETIGDSDLEHGETIGDGDLEHGETIGDGDLEHGE